MQKILGQLVVGIAFAVTVFFSPVTYAQYTNSLIFQGVTFNTYAVDNDTMELQILNAVSGGTGNWADITHIRSIDIREVNSGQISVGTVEASPGGVWSPTVTAGLNSDLGCQGGNTPGACFTTSPALALDDDMVWRFTFTGSNLNFDFPHVKVQFTESSTQIGNATGDLLSQNIPAIPEPEIYAMMLAGLGLMGFVARRRQRDSAA